MLKCIIVKLSQKKILDGPNWQIYVLIGSSEAAKKCRSPPGAQRVNVEKAVYRLNLTGNPTIIGSNEKDALGLSNQVESIPDW